MIIHVKSLSPLNALFNDMSFWITSHILDVINSIGIITQPLRSDPLLTQTHCQFLVFYYSKTKHLTYLQKSTIQRQKGLADFLRHLTILAWKWGKYHEICFYLISFELINITIQYFVNQPSFFKFATLKTVCIAFAILELITLKVYLRNLQCL